MVAGVTADLFVRVRAERLNRNPTLQELKHARMLAARLVVLYGRQYQPIFDIFDAEVRDEEAQMTTLDRLREIAEAAE